MILNATRISEAQKVEKRIVKCSLFIGNCENDTSILSMGGGGGGGGDHSLYINRISTITIMSPTGSGDELFTSSKLQCMQGSGLSMDAESFNVANKGSKGKASSIMAEFVHQPIVLAAMLCSCQAVEIRVWCVVRCSTRTRHLQRKNIKKRSKKSIFLWSHS